MCKSLAAALLLLSGLGTAQANKPTPIVVPPPPVKSPRIAAPEIDLASLNGAIAVLIGGLAVLRGRRSQQRAISST